MVVKWSIAEPVKHELFTAKSRKSPVDAQSTEFYILVACLAFLAIVLGSIMVYMFRLQKSYELNKFRHDTPFFNSHRNHPSSVRKYRLWSRARSNFVLASNSI